LLTKKQIEYLARRDVERAITEQKQWKISVWNWQRVQQREANIGRIQSAYALPINLKRNKHELIHEHTVSKANEHADDLQSGCKQNYQA